ncbi:Protein_phosphatase 2C [Hexamita inflata]|uniref:Protein phosphatase 2C n=1 Tax=Hexamita inflata TaxID=28002 RepID=A0AA86NEF6_9EUKA|nr:Protein phosphatase 2C [Hexamita inflata]
MQRPIALRPLASSRQQTSQSHGPQIQSLQPPRAKSPIKQVKAIYKASAVQIPPKPIRRSEPAQRSDNESKPESKPEHLSAMEPQPSFDPGPLSFGCTSILGRRNQNEDAHLTFETHEIQCACVFDGHGGPEVSQYCVQRFPNLLKAALSEIGTSIRDALKYAISELDKCILQNWAFYEIGCTATIFIMEKLSERVIIANIGDSKTILGFYNRVFSTLDHKPTRQSEVNRLKKIPKSFISEQNGISRLNGNLSLTRSLGDAYMRQFGIIADPEFYEFAISSNEAESKVNISNIESDQQLYQILSQQTQQLKYCILACDGLFDIFTPEAVDDMVRSMLSNKVINLNQTPEWFLKTALLLFHDEFDSALQLIKKQRAGNQMAQVNLQQMQQHPKIVAKIESLEPTKRIGEVLTLYAYLSGCTDNITVIVGIIQ